MCATDTRESDDVSFHESTPRYQRYIDEGVAAKTATA